MMWKLRDLSQMKPDAKNNKKKKGEGEWESLRVRTEKVLNCHLQQVTLRVDCIQQRQVGQGLIGSVSYNVKFVAFYTRKSLRHQEPVGIRLPNHEEPGQLGIWIPWPCSQSCSLEPGEEGWGRVLFNKCSGWFSQSRMCGKYYSNPVFLCVWAFKEGQICLR